MDVSDIFFCFSTRGRDKESPRRRAGGGDDFFLKIPGGGGWGSPAVGAGRDGVGRVFAGQFGGGGGLNIFFRAESPTKIAAGLSPPTPQELRVEEYSG